MPYPFEQMSFGDHKLNAVQTDLMEVSLCVIDVF